MIGRPLARFRKLFAALILVTGCSRDSGGTPLKTGGDGGFTAEEIALVHCAERFVLENGYTADPSAANFAHFKRELMDDGSVEDVLSHRRGTLLPSAVGFCPNELEASFGARITFRYRDPTKATGRAVIVGGTCGDAIMGHKDANLVERAELETGCRPTR